MMKKDQFFSWKITSRNLKLFAFNQYSPFLHSRKMAFKTDEEMWNLVRGISKKKRCEEIFKIELSDEDCMQDAFSVGASANSIKELLGRGDEESKSVALAQLDLLESGTYPLLPKDLRKFKAGWMDNPKNPTNAANRRAAFSVVVRKLGDFLSNGMKEEDLPEKGCDENCDCPMRRNVVGDRGGTPRRVPCRLGKESRKGLKKFAEHRIIMVRS